MKNKTELRIEHIKRTEDILFKHIFFKKILVFEIIDLIFVVLMASVEKFIAMGFFIVLLFIFPIIIKMLIKSRSTDKIKEVFYQNKHKIVYNIELNEEEMNVEILIDDRKKEYKYPMKKIKKVIVSDFVFIITDELSFYVLDKEGFDNYDKLELKNIFFGKIKFVEGK